MAHQNKYLIHSICIDALNVVLWTAALCIFVFQFHTRSRLRQNSSRILQINLRASAISYVVTYLLSWILWMILEIALLREEEMLAYVCSIAYSLIKYLLTNLSFYALILSRLKLTFKDTMYEVRIEYFIIVLVAAIISLSLNIWWRVAYGTGDTFINEPPKLHSFVLFCTNQFYVVDAAIQLSMIYLFNMRLFRLITASREDLSHFGAVTSTPCSEIANDLNHRQQQLVKTVSKHTLLIGIMIGANLIWMIWCFTWPDGPDEQIRDDQLLEIVEHYIFFGLNLIQLFALYVGFDFANEWYNKVFPKAHKLCEGCCKRIAVKHIERELQTEAVAYRALKEEG